MTWPDAVVAAIPIQRRVIRKVRRHGIGVDLDGVRARVRPNIVPVVVTDCHLVTRLDGPGPVFD